MDSTAAVCEPNAVPLKATVNAPALLFDVAKSTGIEPGCVRTGQRYRSDILPFIVRGSTPVAFQGIGCGALQLELHLVAEAGTNMRCFLIDVAIGIGIVLHVNAAWAGK